MIIDARGLVCPRPMAMADEALQKIGEGAVEVLVDNEGAVGNLNWFANKNSLRVESSREGRDWRVRIIKEASSCQAVAEAEAPEKDLLLVVGTDAMGKEEELGRVLMKGFFETIKVSRELPHTIFFLNAGVKLTTTDEEIIPLLKDIENMGAEIYSCGTCLKYYGLEDRIRVGRRGSTDIVVGGLKNFKRTVWI